MQIFVSESVCGGGWPAGEISGSLAIEGRAMLTAIVDDLSRIPNVDVVTTWDPRLGPPPFQKAHSIHVHSPEQESQLFSQFAAECDATLVIAPELGGELFRRCQIVESVGGRLLGPDSRAVALCTDKLQLAEHLLAAGVATIPTALCDFGRSAAEQGGIAGQGGAEEQGGGGEMTFPLVVKPRDGAGSQDVRLIANSAQFDRFAQQYLVRLGDGERGEFIRQPYVTGHPCSVAVLISTTDTHHGQAIDVFPPADQCLSDDGCFAYHGGRIPAANTNHAALQETARRACQAVPGLRGYVGVDLIVPATDTAPPTVVEINPRLTTSYLGYRALAEDNLAEWLVTPARYAQAIRWRRGTVVFDASGRIVDSGGI